MSSTTRQSHPVGCAVIAQAIFRATASEIPGLRKAPGSFDDVPVAPSLLRHADEQTVLGLCALLLAARQTEAAPGVYADWAVLAAPRFLGRAKFEAAFPQFLAEGAWGVSPHLVPSHSLHSASGMISLAIKAHGPNLGIGGATGSGREGLLAAATLLETRMVPGVWLVLSNRIGDREGEAGIHPPGDYEAMAIALVLEQFAPSSLRLRVVPDRLQIDVSTGTVSAREELADWLGLSLIEPDSTVPGAGSMPRLDGGTALSPSLSPHFRTVPTSSGRSPAIEGRNDR